MFVFCLAAGFFIAAVGRGALPGDAGWPTFGYGLDNARHVPFVQINASTVHDLRLLWKYRTGVYGPFETSPIVVGRTMFITTGADQAVVALDATSGARLWRYATPVSPVQLCCGLVNRGVAVSSGLVFFLTIDDRLIALDERNGRKRWETRVADPALSYTETMAPLAWHGMAFVGSSGGDIASRGFVAAYAQADGKPLWRWWAVSPGWEGRYVTSAHHLSLHRNIALERRDAARHRDAWRQGGGSVWMTPALDPARNLLYVGVGNPPQTFSDSRPGDNLYTASVVALDVRTGRLRWYYQEVPHDIWDYDAGSPPVLFTARDARGKPIDAVGQASKTGWFYLLDRANGAEIRISEPFVPQHDIFGVPTASGVAVTPSGYGGAVAPVAYDPATRRVFIQAKQGTFFKRFSDTYWKAQGPHYETLSALDVDSGRILWRRIISPANGLNRVEGPLSAADLIFIGEESGGTFEALSAQTGERLWSYHTGPGDENEDDVPHRSVGEYVHDVIASIKHWVMREARPASQSHIVASPVAYVVDGREYIAIASGANYRHGRSPGDTLYVFALPR
ncbi:MAG: PQQ-binding-like beta-propeller repeat protein [Candidatus Eremiobacteraeota bacterium]|nr:PQQ-binding-like beta-propeller repeat protein [Candidatus Eremiobacteraeota bacterium]